MPLISVRLYAELTSRNTEEYRKLEFNGHNTALVSIKISQVGCSKLDDLSLSLLCQVTIPSNHSRRELTYYQNNYELEKEGKEESLRFLGDRFFFFFPLQKQAEYTKIGTCPLPQAPHTHTLSYIHQRIHCINSLIGSQFLYLS